MGDGARLKGAVDMALDGAGRATQQELVARAARIHGGIEEKLRAPAHLFASTRGHQKCMVIAELLEQAARSVKP